MRAVSNWLDPFCHPTPRLPSHLPSPLSPFRALQAGATGKVAVAEEEGAEAAVAVQQAGAA